MVDEILFMYNKYDGIMYQLLITYRSKWFRVIEKRHQSMERLCLMLASPRYTPGVTRYLYSVSWSCA